MQTSKRINIVKTVKDTSRYQALENILVRVFNEEYSNLFSDSEKTEILKNINIEEFEESYKISTKFNNVVYEKTLSKNDLIFYNLKLGKDARIENKKLVIDFFSPIVSDRLKKVKNNRFKNWFDLHSRYLKDLYIFMLFLVLTLSNNYLSIIVIVATIIALINLSVSSKVLISLVLIAQYLFYNVNLSKSNYVDIKLIIFAFFVSNYFIRIKYETKFIQIIYSIIIFMQTIIVVISRNDYNYLIFTMLIFIVIFSILYSRKIQSKKLKFINLFLFIFTSGIILHTIITFNNILITILVIVLKINIIFNSILRGQENVINNGLIAALMVDFL